jgi:predicted nucleic acid-binding Zn ribbon protein
VGDRLEEPVRLRALLDPFGSKLGSGAAADVARLWSGWADIVGPVMAQHAEPSSFRDGVLRVRADSPTWATEITYLTETIRAAANQWLGRATVREVRVWMGPAKPQRGPAQPLGEPRRRDRERPDPGATPDPVAAFERARRAWAERRSGGRRKTRDSPLQNGKTPW